MKVGLISDTHGDADAWRRAMGVFGDCDLILHAGDHLYHGAFNPVLPTYDPKELAREINDCPIPILHARGNCDSEVDQTAIDDPILAPYAFCRLEGLNIMAVHGDGLSEEELSGMAARYGVGLLLRGHTHVRGMRRSGSALLLNPGSPSLPKGDGIPTVAVLEGTELFLVDLRDGGVLEKGRLPGD